MDLLPLFLLLNILKILTLQSLVGCTKRDCIWNGFLSQFLISGGFPLLALNSLPVLELPALPLTFEGNVFVLVSVSSHLFLSLPPPPLNPGMLLGLGDPGNADALMEPEGGWLCPWSSGSFCSLISTLLDPHLWFKAIVLVGGLGSLFYQSPCYKLSPAQP